MSSPSLIEAASRWVVEKYPYNSLHLLMSLEWLDRLAPGASESVRLATLTHDMERAFPGPDQPQDTTLVDPVYYRAHSERSARIVASWLAEQGAPEELIAQVEALILVHEFGGWNEANLVQAADSLSFLEVNIDLFLGFAKSGKFSPEAVRHKFDYTIARIQISEAREFARPMHKRAIERLEAQLAKRPIEVM